METDQAGQTVAAPARSSNGALYLAAGVYLACGVAWLAVAALNGAFARSTTIREVVGLFVVVNGPAVIALISPGRLTALMLLVVTALMAVASLFFAFAAKREGITAGPLAFVFPAVFVALAALSWRAWRRAVA